MKNSILLILLLLFLSACSVKNSAETTKGIVIISPEVAEIIAQLGAVDEIIAVTDECTWPESLKDKPSVGKFGEIKMEEIIKLNPSIVFTTQLEQQDLADNLEKLGIKVVRIYPKSVSEVYTAIQAVGKEIGRVKEAEVLVNSLKLEVNNYKSNREKRPDVYLEIWNNPLMSVTDNSFVGELIELAGGNNIFSELERDYSRVKPEKVITANPDIILSFSKTTLDDFRARKGWQNIKAVKSGKVYGEESINPDYIFRAGPRFVLGLKALNSIFTQYEE